MNLAIDSQPKETAVSRYLAQIEAYDSIDGALALCVFLANAFLGFAAAKIIQSMAAFSQVFVYLISGVYAFAVLALVFLVCARRGQPLCTLGITSKGIALSLFFGVLGCAVIVALKGGLRHFAGTLASAGALGLFVQLLYQLLFIALPEEIIFRGYIGTRLRGVINSSFTTALLTGVLWALAHVPFQLVIQNLSLAQYLSANWQGLVIIVILHFVFQWGYEKTNSLVAPVLWHLVWNL